MRQLLAWEKWDEVRKGLEQIRKKTGETWLPEDVYASIVVGQSRLFEIGTGFAVVQINIGPRGPFLFVWCLYMPPGNEKGAVISALDSLAKGFGCSVIRFHSPRDGWGAYLRDEFEQKAVVYEREVL